MSEVLETSSLGDWTGDRVPRSPVPGRGPDRSSAAGRPSQAPGRAPGWSACSPGTPAWDDPTDRPETDPSWTSLLLDSREGERAGSSGRAEKPAHEGPESPEENQNPEPPRSSAPGGAEERPARRGDCSSLSSEANNSRTRERKPSAKKEEKLSRTDATRS